MINFKFYAFRFDKDFLIVNLFFENDYKRRERPLPFYYPT
jgi:hypothetical protein